MNLDSITLEDCIDMYFKKENTAIINDGRILGFESKGKQHSTFDNEVKFIIKLNY